MTFDEKRCAEARKFERIDDEFRRGDLEALRAVVDDPAVVPNGPMPHSIGSCLAPLGGCAALDPRCALQPIAITGNGENSHFVRPSLGADHLVL